MASDSSDEETKTRLGNTPTSHYKDFSHIGYDVHGSKVLKPPTLDSLMEQLQRSEDPDWWLRLYDELNAQHVKITPELLETIRKIRSGKSAVGLIDPYQGLRITTEAQAVNAIPEPKRRFQPSKTERMKIARIAYAISRGWIRPEKKKEEEELFDLWTDEGLSDIPGPPREQLPGHGESYNPPAEYDSEKTYDCLRKVPRYKNSMTERYSRCLDLLLCPRIVKSRLNIKPESLIPKLPDMDQLKPFPTDLKLKYPCKGRVLCLEFSPSGEFLATGDKSGELIIWESSTAAVLERWSHSEPISQVAWNPTLPCLAYSCANAVHFVMPKYLQGNPWVETDVPASKWVTWSVKSDKISVHLKKDITNLVWHPRGDYLATVAAKESVSSQLAIHSLSKHNSVKLFSKKSRGQIQCVTFHPSKAIIYVATVQNVLVYNLKQQSLMKKFVGCEMPDCITVHSTGDHIIVGCQDKRLHWYDTDLGSTPYKTFEYHKRSISSVSLHSRYPLMATGSFDCSVQVFHAMVYNDFVQNPYIIPLKSLKLPKISLGVRFHPRQPWLATTAGKNVYLYI